MSKLMGCIVLVRHPRPHHLAGFGVTVGPGGVGDGEPGLGRDGGGPASELVEETAKHGANVAISPRR